MQDKTNNYYTNHTHVPSHTHLHMYLHVLRKGEICYLCLPSLGTPPTECAHSVRQAQPQTVHNQQTKSAGREISTSSIVPLTLNYSVNLGLIKTHG